MFVVYSSYVTISDFWLKYHSHLRNHLAFSAIYYVKKNSNAEKPNNAAVVTLWIHALLCACETCGYGSENCFQYELTFALLNILLALYA
jgi:hypothetical protein